MIPIFTRLPSGDLLIEADLTRFQQEFQKTPKEDRVKLKDGRLGLRRHDVMDPESYTVMTVHQEVWERMVFAAKRQTSNMKEFLTRFEQKAAPAKKRLCKECGAEQKERMEKEQWWSFYCPSCEKNEIWGKNLIGGTWGAGEKEIF